SSTPMLSFGLSMIPIASAQKRVSSHFNQRTIVDRKRTAALREIEPEAIDSRRSLDEDGLDWERSRDPYALLRRPKVTTRRDRSCDSFSGKMQSLAAFHDSRHRRYNQPTD